MKKLLELGDHYVSDFMKPDAEMRETKPWSLDLYLDEEIGAARLDGVAPLDKMYGQYWYRSGINASMTKQLGDIVSEITNRVKIENGDVWLDIACNDGSLLDSFKQRGWTTFGVDPAENLHAISSAKGHTIICDY